MKNKTKISQEMQIVKIGKARTKADKFFENFPKVLYKVTNGFGNSPIGEIREAFLINYDGPSALLYHPQGYSKYCCGSFEIAIRKENLFLGTHYVSSKENYCNVYGDSFKLKKK